MCAKRFRLLVEPHEEPKRVRCCVKPTRLVLDLVSGAWRAKGPRRVVVEKDLDAGDKEVKVRVSGEAYRSVPLGMADIMSLVPVPLDCRPELVLAGIRARSDETGTLAIKSGISTRLLSCGIGSRRSRSCTLLASVFCLCATGAGLLCHGALSTPSILGHSSEVVVAICCMLTGAIPPAAWKAILA